MRKKSAYAWCLVAALTMAGCSSDQNEDVDVSAKTGTFEIAIDFANPDGGTRVSTAVPTTSWSNIKQIQFFLYDASGNIKWSAIETPTDGTPDGTGKKYMYASVPADTYTLVALANAQSATDDVATYVSNTLQPWSVANVANNAITNLAIKHKVGSWNTAITGSALTALSGLTPHTQPSEVFMGYQTNVIISSAAAAPATINLKREVSMIRVRIDQTTVPTGATSAAAVNVDFLVPGAGIMLYNLPEQMGIQQGNTGGIKTTYNTITSSYQVSSIAANVLSINGAYSTSTTGTDYLEAPYTSWKEAIVFPNNDGRATDGSTGVIASKPYFIVICGVAKAGHKYSGGADAVVGAPVFWYGQINEVFTPNNIREVNVVLVTGGYKDPPTGIVEFGGLTITVNEPLPWGSIVVADPIEM